jgi:hypothetical protein
VCPCVCRGWLCVLVSCRGVRRARRAQPPSRPAVPQRMHATRVKASGHASCPVPSLERSTAQHHPFVGAHFTRTHPTSARVCAQHTPDVNTTLRECTLQTHTHTHTRTRAHAHARTHARSHARTQAHTHTHRDTHAHTHTHTRRRSTLPPGSRMPTLTPTTRPLLSSSTPPLLPAVCVCVCVCVCVRACVCVCARARALRKPVCTRVGPGVCAAAQCGGAWLGRQGWLHTATAAQRAAAPERAR